MQGIDLYSVKDGKTLRRTIGGLEIIRRNKHNWRDFLDNLTAKKLAVQTDKVYGSKFLRDWTLPIPVDWIEGVINQEQWLLQPGVPVAVERQFDRVVGLVEGQTNA